MIRRTTSGAATLYETSAAELGAWVSSSPIAPSSAPVGAVVACGPMFDRNGPRFTIRDRARGVDVATREPNVGATVRAWPDRVEVVTGGAPGDAPVAIQGYPAMIVGGRVLSTALHDGETVGRVALAVMPGARVALAVATASMVAFARALAAAGATAAVYLDGGSSTWLRTAEHTHGTGARPLPSFITLGASTPNERASTGGGAEIAAVAVVAFALSRRRRR